MAGLLDYLEALGETGAMLGTGAVSGMAGMPYGVYKGMRSGKYGTPEGVRIAEEEARKFIERNTYQPRSQMAQNALGYAGGLLSDARLPPVIPEAAALSAIPLRPAARMAGEGVAATGRFVAPKVGQLAEQYMVKTGGILPLDVYHGTPHTLPPTPRNLLGEFDASKIGTGEGAQVYGHGIYVAESPAVATGYREKLSKNVIVDGGKLSSIPSDSPLAQAQNQVITSIQNGMTPEQAIAHSQQYWMNAASEMEAMKSAHPELASQIDLQVTSRRNVANAASKLNPASFYKEPGNLYKVDLPDEMIPKMLDWDKPLSQQKNVIDALTPENMGLTLRPSVNGGYMAYLADGKPIGLQVKGVTPKVFRERWLERLKEMGDLEGGAGRAVGYLGGTVSGDLPPLVSKALRQAGIPGIKYLDEMSRSAGEGTRNFVVFPGEEKNMTILERNGQLAEELKRLQAGGLLAP